MRVLGDAKFGLGLRVLQKNRKLAVEDVFLGITDGSHAVLEANVVLVALLGNYANADFANGEGKKSGKTPYSNKQGGLNVKGKNKFFKIGHGGFLSENSRMLI
jgi:hypothetical protein